MGLRQALALSALLILSGCLYHARENTDARVAEIVSHPYDVAPPPTPEVQTPPPPPGLQSNQHGEQKAAVETAGTSSKTGSKQSNSTSMSAQKDRNPTTPKTDVQTTAYMEQATEVPPLIPENRPRMEPKIPPEIPGSEAKPLAAFPREEQAKQKAILKLFPELPALPIEPTALEGPEGRPLTLAELQQMAAANSPDLRQAASDVEAARGSLVQARTYANPTVTWQNAQPSNNNNQSGVMGATVDQVVKFGGKMKLASAAAEMDLRNAEMSLRRARFDLATRVRNAYYTLLVAKETMRLNRAMARFTDEIYRLQVGLLQAGQVADYEPMALRSQAYVARLSHQQSIQAYIYAWEGLVAKLGLRQMPLTQVEGRIDRVIPYYEYDKVLAHVLRNHTDLQVARNGMDKARYSLKLAQIAPFPDPEFNLGWFNDFADPPKQSYPTAAISIPFPIFDQNKGNIIAAEAAMVHATEEPHRVEVNLVNTLANAYQGYKSNLQGLDYFRHYILPDQVRAYRGVLEARQINPNIAFSDLYTAQQTLMTDVTTYLGVLGSLWSSVVSVADLLQTDDLFQMAEPKEIPGLPDLDQLPALPCCHPSAGSTGEMQPAYQSYPPSAWPATPPGDPAPSASGDGRSAKQAVAETAGKAVFAGAPAEAAPVEPAAGQTPVEAAAEVRAGTHP